MVARRTRATESAFLRPEVAIVTNVEFDHHTNYAGLDDVDDVFRRFVALLP